MGWIWDSVETRCAANGVRAKMRTIAAKALKDSDLKELIDAAGIESESEEASAALKMIIAEHMVEYTERAIKMAKSRGTSLKASTIVIASKQG